MNCTWAATWGAGEGSKAALSGSEGGLLGKAAQQHRTEFVLLCCQVMQCVCVCGGGGGAPPPPPSPGQQERALADHLLERGVVVHGHASAKKVVGVILASSVGVSCRGAQHKHSRRQNTSVSY
jgi:hypothetical protein